MEPTNMVAEGVELMFLGMGSVFGFLILLVTCTSIMSASVDPDVVAAIGAAIKHHRSRRSS